MNKLFLLTAATALGLVLSPQSFAQYYDDDVQVDGYTRDNGTYVAPHTRTAPNDVEYDNYSYGSSSSSDSSYDSPSPSNSRIDTYRDNSGNVDIQTDGSFGYQRY